MKEDRELEIGSLGRRSFLKRAAGAAISIGGVSLFGAGSARADELGPLKGKARIDAFYAMRDKMAAHSEAMPLVDHVDNGDEDKYPNKIGSFHKALPHNDMGEVDLAAYTKLRAALDSGNFLDFENLTLGGRRRLVNPQAGLAYEMEGLDSRCFRTDPAPTLDSARRAAEYVEDSWMALLRDVPFDQFDSDPMALQACDDLSKCSDFSGPKQDGKVTPATLFRGSAPGMLRGPFISQFLLKPIPFGAMTNDQRVRTVVPGRSYLTSFDDWLDIQNGALAAADAFDDTPRYVRNGRDLAQWVHMDVLFESMLNAGVILAGYNAPVDLGNPYSISLTQEGFGTLGCPYNLAMIADVAGRALRAVWYQKWFVHRTIRPEAYGGLVQLARIGKADYPIHMDALNSGAVDMLHSHNGNALLPQAYPEGCPVHPSYPEGHATVAAACCTVLRAVYDEQYTMEHPVTPNADGTKLERLSGPDADFLNVGSELNKLVMNIGLGRCIAGVHWRSDFDASVKLGEQVALQYLVEQIGCLNEPHSYTLSLFDGSIVKVTSGGVA